MTRSHGAIVTALAAASVLAGCATGVPQMHDFGKPEAKEVARESNLVAHLKCELTRTLLRIQVENEDNAIAEDRDHIPESLRGYPADWLFRWGAKASLKLNVEEDWSAGPNVSITVPLANHISTFATGGNVTTSRAFTLPLSITGSTKAIRTETIGFTFAFADLLAASEDSWQADATARGEVWNSSVEDRYRRKQAATACAAYDDSLMDGDLKIYDFIRSKVQVSRTPALIPRKGAKSPFDAFNYEIQFVVARSGSASPGWKLYPIAIDQSGSLLSAARTKTDDLILTLGEQKGEQLSQDAQDAHLAALIGQEVAKNLGARAP